MSKGVAAKRELSHQPKIPLIRGGSVEHCNEESGEVWLRRLLRTYPHAAWLNPLPADRWRYFPSAGMISELFEGRMFGLTLDGLDAAMRELSH